MKNIHVLPTDKPSKLWFNLKGKLVVDTVNCLYEDVQCQHIYITNDEEIKEGDWFIFGVNESVLRMLEAACKANIKYNGAKKIMLTTDPQLIKFGVQAIDDEFLEWFVKNPSCEYVTVYDGLFGEDRIWKKYIIIPKEEILLEEVFNDDKKENIKKFIDEINNPSQPNDKLKQAFVKYSECLEDFENKDTYEHGFKDGAKWQQEIGYSEEEVIQLLQKALTHQDDGETGSLVTAQGKIRTANFFSWFEKFKKK